MIEKLLVPDIGDFENVEVIELLVKEGQEIKKNDPVVIKEKKKSEPEKSIQRKKLKKTMYVTFWSLVMYKK